MVFINEAMTWTSRQPAVLRDFLILLQPFAPHLAEELWSKLNSPPPPAQELTQPSPYRTGPMPLAYAPWPEFNPELLAEDIVEIPSRSTGSSAT